MIAESTDVFSDDDQDTTNVHLREYETMINFQSHTNPTLLAAMAIQTHAHTMAKKVLSEHFNKVIAPSLLPDLAGTLPPVKLNKLDDGVLNRMKQLKKYKLKNNPSKKTALRASKSDGDISFSEAVDKEDSISLQLPDTSVKEVPPSSFQDSNSGTDDRGIAGNTTQVASKMTKVAFAKSGILIILYDVSIKLFDDILNI